MVLCKEREFIEGGKFLFNVISIGRRDGKLVFCGPIACNVLVGLVIMGTSNLIWLIDLLLFWCSVLQNAKREARM